MDDHEVVDTERHVTRMWSKGGYGHYTEREDMYLSLIDKMLPSFKGGSVLEVGPGTGLFAKKMMDKFDISSYVILDLESQISKSMRALAGYPCQFFLSQHFELLFGREFDLFVSNVCLPETPGYYRDALCRGVFGGCSKALVIGGDRAADGDEYQRWVREIFAGHFESVSEEETGYCNTFAISGESSCQS